MGRNQRRWQKKYDDCMRIAKAQAGTAEGNVAAAKATQIAREHLQGQPQAQRWGGKGLLGLVKRPKSPRQQKAEQQSRDRYQRDRHDDGQRYGSGDAPPRGKHARLARAREERLAWMTRGERRRFLAQEARERERRG